MKKVVFFSVCFFLQLCTVFSQTLNQQLKNQIDRIVAKDERKWFNSSYKGNVTITDVKEDGTSLTIYGTYDYQNWWDGYRSISYTAKAKAVLQEIVVSEVCWIYNGAKTCAY
jgi:hypothetical protein